MCVLVTPLQLISAWSHGQCYHHPHVSPTIVIFQLYWDFIVCGPPAHSCLNFGLNVCWNGHRSERSLQSSDCSLWTHFFLSPKHNIYSSLEHFPSFTNISFFRAVHQFGITHKLYYATLVTFQWHDRLSCCTPQFQKCTSL